MRKVAARATGTHGFLSGKPSEARFSKLHLGQKRQRQSAIYRATRELETPVSSPTERYNKHWSSSYWLRRRWTNVAASSGEYQFVLQKTLQDEFDSKARMRRLKEIGNEMQQAGERLAQLACEKDVLQERHNPLWKYEVKDYQRASLPTNASSSAARHFNFPNDDLVVDYLDMLFVSGRLTHLNHTELWRNENLEEPDEFDDEFLGPIPRPIDEQKQSEEEGTAGSWLLRNGLGEKIGVATERAAYKAVCKALMSVLARSLGSLHGISVMAHSDIRITMEQTPSLPPLAGHIPGSDGNRNYAQATIKSVMQRGSRANRNRKPKDDFIQKAAVVETLLSQCQIAAPIMKLFPLAWQRALLGNILSMVTALITDFCEGVEFQLLGHRLALSFTPITEDDMMEAIHSSGGTQNRPTRDPETFEAAVQATAEDMAEELQFLDRWHERALGGGVLRSQIATLIARLVLTLVDDILVASKMDLWTSQAGGPRMFAGLEYRSSPSRS